MEGEPRQSAGGGHTSSLRRASLQEACFCCYTPGAEPPKQFSTG